MSDTTLEILKYGNPLLRKKSEPVTQVDDELCKQVEQMTPLLYEFQGVGLAAPQVGIMKRFFICDVDWIEDEDGNPGQPKVQIFINPEILSESTEDEAITEGCLSIPKVEGEVYRPTTIEIQYRDLDWNLHKKEINGLLARVAQHEIDHLEGVLFIDRMSFPKRTMLAGQLRKLKKQTLQKLDL